MVDEHFCPLFRHHLGVRGLRTTLALRARLDVVGGPEKRYPGPLLENWEGILAKVCLDSQMRCRGVTLK